jgi:hypothetical protein
MIKNSSKKSGKGCGAGSNKHKKTVMQSGKIDPMVAEPPKASL